MITVVCSLADPVSETVARIITSSNQFRVQSPINGNRCLRSENLQLLEITDKHINADWLNGKLETDLIVFPSSHFSSVGVGSFTTHAEGNWSEKALFGGKPKSLSVAAPASMLKILNFLAKNKNGLEVSYEATHHGPFLDTPSLFVEVGGNKEIKSKKNTEILADAVMSLTTADNNPEFQSVGFGIGSGHYPNKFTKLALSGRYAFSHIMSKHYVDNLDMLEPAFYRSSPKADVAVIEWKGIKSEERKKIITRLEQLGIEYVKV